MPIKIEYQDISIAQVIEFFVDGFKLKKNQKILKYEHFYDPHKGTVILKLFISEETDAD